MSKIAIALYGTWYCATDLWELAIRSRKLFSASWCKVRYYSKTSALCKLQKIANGNPWENAGSQDGRRKAENRWFLWHSINVLWLPPQCVYSSSTGPPPPSGTFTSSIMSKLLYSLRSLLFELFYLCHKLKKRFKCGLYGGASRHFCFLNEYLLSERVFTKTCKLSIKVETSWDTTVGMYSHQLWKTPISSTFAA